MTTRGPATQRTQAPTYSPTLMLATQLAQAPLYLPTLMFDVLMEPVRLLAPLSTILRLATQLKTSAFTTKTAKGDVL